MFSKSIVATALVLLAVFQLVNASVFSQLQFIKIKSPKNNEVFEAGEKVKIEYIMQPLVYHSTSMGKALKLGVHFHSRTGNKKQQKLATVSNSCPISASQSKFVTHKTTWTIPKNTKPGSYAFDFDENVQLRRGQMKVKETIKVSVVEK